MNFNEYSKSYLLIFHRISSNIIITKFPTKISVDNVAKTLINMLLQTLSSGKRIEINQYQIESDICFMINMIRVLSMFVAHHNTR